jgi:hypothetical protein
MAELVVGRAPPYIWAVGLALVVGGPWLLPGYIFGTDWPGPRHLPFPDQVWSGAVFQLARAATSAVLSAEVATKILVLGSLFLAAFFSYRALPVGGFTVRACAATLYTVNPFVYGRIHYGQLPLVAAYSLLPLLLIGLRNVVLKPGVRPAVVIAIALSAIGSLDLHLLLPAGTLAVIAVVGNAIARLNDPKYTARLAASAVGAAALTICANAYWLIPLLTGSNQQGHEVAGFTEADLAVFRTVPDSVLGLLPNVLGLYGFWAENVFRFPSMKEFVPFWPLILLALLSLAAVGVAANMWRPGVAFAGARTWILALLAAGAVAVLLDMGIAEPHVRPLVQWLDHTFPPYRGMRDAEKWAALLALVYAQLVPLGVIVILEWLRRKHLPRRVGWLQVVAAALFVALPLYYGNGLLFGMHAEVRPSAYPAGWYAADRILLSDRQPGDTLFLPWHLYLRFGFIKNSNAVVATPAPSFFSVPVLVSADPELAGLKPSNTPDQALVSRLVSANGHADWPHALATIDVKYVLLAREVDWSSYRYLDDQVDLVRVADFGSIILYRNADWRPSP